MKAIIPNDGSMFFGYDLEQVVMLENELLCNGIGVWSQGNGEDYFGDSYPLTPAQ